MGNVQLNKELLGMGFSLVKKNADPRAIIASHAHDKCGKTHWAASAKGPVCFFNLDQGDEGVVDKLASLGKDIVIKTIKFPKPKMGEKAEERVKRYEPIYDDFRDSWYKACESKLFNTVVTDTHSHVNELLRLARFGKLEQVVPEAYGPVNAEFEELSNYPKQFPGLNAIYIHKLGKKYVKAPGQKRGEWDGTYERKGYSGMNYVAQVNLEHYRTEGGGFGIRIVNNRFQSSLDGMELEDEMCTFQFLMTQLFPDTVEEEWL